MRHLAAFLLSASVTLSVAAHPPEIPAHITALREQIVLDTANLRSVARQIKDTQNASSEQLYVTARLKLDQDVIQLRAPLLEPIQTQLRQTWAQAEATALAGDYAQAAMLRAEYRRQKSIFRAYKSSLVSDF